MKKFLLLLLFTFTFTFTFAQTYSQNESVQVLWQGQWYPGKILKVTGTQYLISYDGYGSEWNETVGTDRLKKASAESTSNGQQQLNNPNTTSSSGSSSTALVNSSGQPYFASVETIWDMHLDKSGKYIVCASAYGNIKVLNANDLTLVTQIEVGKDPMMCVSISDDDLYIAASGKTVHIYKQNGTGGYDAYMTLTDYSDVSKIRFIPGTHNLVAGGYLSSNNSVSRVDLWSVDDMKIIKNILPAGAEGSIMGIDASADGKYLAMSFSTVMHGIDVYDISTGKLSYHLVSKMDISSCTFSPDGTSIAGGGIEQKVICWSTSTHKQLWASAWKTEESAYIYGVTYSADGKTVAACGMGSGCCAKIYDAATGIMKKEIGTDNPNGNAILYSDASSLCIAFTTYGDIAKVAVVEKFSTQ